MSERTEGRTAGAPTGMDRLSVGRARAADGLEAAGPPPGPAGDAATPLAGTTFYEDEIDLGREIAAAVRVFARRAAEAHVGIEVAAVAAPARVRGDRAKIRQILVCLVSEAIDFTPPRGTVAISTAIEGTGELTFAVAHTGIGARSGDGSACLPGAAARRLWHGFSGPGLGLALAQALAECHGGRLRLDNPPGQGARVRVTLPRDRVLS